MAQKDQEERFECMEGEEGSGTEDGEGHPVSAEGEEQDLEDELKGDEDLGGAEGGEGNDEEEEGVAANVELRRSVVEEGDVK